MNYQGLMFWAVLGAVIVGTSQCSFGNDEITPNVPVNEFGLTRCEVSCMDLRDACGARRIDYGGCIANCVDITQESALTEVERRKKCFSELPNCNPELYARTCLVNGGVE